MAETAGMASVTGLTTLTASMVRLVRGGQAQRTRLQAKTFRAMVPGSCREHGGEDFERATSETRSS